ncbi:MAG TPA: hypothetical protein VK256_04200 [Candidatus Eisenbacteria bacterium]|nr:hypothetical protein [Candidatus Eisenbacteria bacterium]
MRRSALLALAVIAYIVAAWMVAPGFYDGFGPQQPYNWTCPPPQAGANQKPTSGHVDIKVIGGVSDANSAFTNDAQIVLGFLPGAFDATGKTSISVDVTPLSTCPHPPGIMFVTNVYLVTASAPLVKPAHVVMLYSNLMAAPSAIYQAADPAGPWKSIGANRDAMPYTITTTTSSLGYFASGYLQTSAASGSLRVGGGQVLPIVVAILIVIVLLAGIPLAVLRRRRPSGEVEEDEDEAKS